LYARWGARIFANITGSEQRHFDELKLLLDRYGLADPAANSAAGIFQNADLQALYSDLIAQGETSLAAALRVGAQIEDLDIHDLDKALAATDNDDLRIVYRNLRWGSENHIRAYVGRLKSMRTILLKHQRAALTEIWQAECSRWGLGARAGWRAR
jgi:hypothetical protein